MTIFWGRGPVPTEGLLDFNLKSHPCHRQKVTPPAKLHDLPDVRGFDSPLRAKRYHSPLAKAIGEGASPGEQA